VVVTKDRMHMVAAVLVLTWCPAAMGQNALADRVAFRSLDDRTTLVGYVYVPRADTDHPAAPAPAVVMMHGRSGLIRALPTADTTPRRFREGIRCGVSCGPRRVMSQS
jgi:hypothetical protein